MDSALQRCPDWFSIVRVRLLDGEGSQNSMVVEMVPLKGGIGGIESPYKARTISGV